MFGLGSVELLIIGAVVVLLLEVALFWAAASLADAPELRWGKTLVIAGVVTAAWLAINGLIGWYSGLVAAPPTADNWTTAALIGAIALGVTWVVPAILYVPLLPVSIPRSMLLSVLQMLLRAFLYVLLAAVVMVVLAMLQIFTGTDVRSDLSDPTWSALAFALPS
jgi:hypothetical protein